MGQARARHCQMPPQAPVWPSAPRERVRCPDHTGRRMVRGRPTGQLWTPLVQPTHGTECGAETLTDTVPPARLPSPRPAPGCSFSECRAPSWGPESPLTLDAPLAQTRSCWRELGSSLTGPRATGDPPKGTMAVMSPWVARGLWGEGRPGARRVPLASPQPHRSHTKTPTPLLPLPAECQNHTQAPSVHLLPPKPAGPLAPGQGRVHLPGHGGGPAGCPLLLGGERAAPRRGLGGGTHLAHERLLEPEQPPGPAQVPVGLRLQRHLHTEWPLPAVTGDPDGSERTW